MYAAMEVERAVKSERKPAVKVWGGGWVAGVEAWRALGVQNQKGDKHGMLRNLTRLLAPALLGRKATARENHLRGNKACRAR